MGTDAEVFLFDYEAYTTEVVPAFLELLRDGRSPDWLLPFLNREEIRPEHWDRADLAQYCDYLNPDLSWRGPYDLTYTHDLKWAQRKCTSETCLERERCTFHQNGSESIAEQINWLFKIAMSIKCLGPGQFVGRSWTTDRYAPTLKALGIGPVDPLLKLLAYLGKRGFIIGYQFGFGFEGINGWLDPSETADLARRLDRLPLPRYETSFAAMDRFRSSGTGDGYEYEGFTFDVLSLSFVRTVSIIAAGQNKGVLWGNGVMPREFYAAQIE